MTQQESTIVGLVFRIDQDGETLLAEFTPVEHWHPIDIPEIRRALFHQNLDTALLDEEALDELSKQYGESIKPFSLAIGKCTNAEVEITVEPDNMSAYLTVMPAHGGKMVTREQIDEALKKAGVVEGILDAQIDVIVATGTADRKLVAQGIAAINGTDAQFKSLIPEIGENGLKVDERGIVDYRELGLFVTVSVGDPLMERIPATSGTIGKNVRGEIIPAKPGKNYTFAKGLKGATYAPRNYDMLVAAIAGQPILTTRGVKVEPTLSVRGVDLSTGNLEFEGSVNISSDVKSGMKIKVTGDLIIGGTVEAAEIHADGNITIRGGIIGQGEKAPEGNTRHDAANISCGGTLSALFVENARVEAGDSIIIGEVAKQSELIANNHIIVGKEGSRKGHIVGGVARATQFIKAIVLGSPAGLHTEVHTGINPVLHSSITSLEIKLEKLYREQEELQRVFTFAKENPSRVRPEILQKAENTQEKLDLDIGTYEEEKTALETKLSLTANAKVIIGKQIFGGSMIHIGHKMWQTTDDKPGGTFRIMDGDIIIENS